MAVPMLMSAAQARAVLSGLEPKPWATDRRAVMDVIKALPPGKLARAVWLSDGLDGDGAAELERSLQSLSGGLDLVTGQSGRQLLPPPEDSPPDRFSRAS